MAKILGLVSCLIFFWGLFVPSSIADTEKNPTLIEISEKESGLEKDYNIGFLADIASLIGLIVTGFTFCKASSAAKAAKAAKVSTELTMKQFMKSGILLNIKTIIGFIPIIKSHIHQKRYSELLLIYDYVCLGLSDFKCSVTNLSDDDKSTIQDLIITLRQIEDKTKSESVTDADCSMLSINYDLVNELISRIQNEEQKNG